MTEKPDGSIKCERCFITIDIGDSKLIIFHDIEDTDKGIPALTRRVCSECFGIVKYASSPESWISTTADTKAKKLYYFDKKQE